MTAPFYRPGTQENKECTERNRLKTSRILREVQGRSSARNAAKPTNVTIHRGETQQPDFRTASDNPGRCASNCGGTTVGNRASPIISPCSVYGVAATI